MKKIISLGVVLGGFMPMLALAAVTNIDTAGGANAGTILFKIQEILNWIIPILITLAVVYFIYGVIQYTVSQDEEKKKKAKSAIIQGLIGLFVIVAFWGIIALVTNTFGVGPAQLKQGAIPCIPNAANNNCR